MFDFFKRQTSSPGAAKPKIHITTACAPHGHPEFRIQVSTSAAEVNVRWFLSYLEGRVAAGEKFGDGESLQVGWMYTRLEQVSPHLLRVLEPDMENVPVQFVDSVDNTLRHLFTQQEAARSFPNVTPDFPSLRQSAVVHENYRAARRILLSRFAAQDESDSGWWLTDLDDEQGAQDPARFSKTSLYQLGVDRPDLIRFFALPVGLQVAIEPGRIGVIDDKGELEQIPGSFLAELNRVGRGG
ncbi:MAG TPA: hypothetical protein VGN52_25520 [Burkholderiales bacterium]|jgi:hypothetical protein